MASTHTNALTAQIIDYLLRTPNCFAYRSNTTGVYDSKRGLYRPSAKRGVPDITGLRNGLIFFVEVKTGSDRLRPDQINFIKSVEFAKGIVIVASDFQSFLSQFQSKFKLE